ncbi:TRAP-type C4-dicarboxylate transport system permease small subunit [Sinorhizobium fredii]|uniref:TRAP transporter small permease protein n=1 Tax=Sinorhizobium fredii (strain USDA 257) TaxID=1185652 RepID=I3X499_SINF2|nr:TRAP transporter small permease [Sinorhizobium fredii]AFL50705.1 putative C4-dicarboxylate transport system, permease protein [Sinorhizobium fredii USDA 257]
MHAIRKFLLSPVQFLLAACLAAMLVLVFGNVVLRYAFNTGISVSEELSRLLFVWLVFLGAAVTLFEQAHLGVDTLIRRLSRKGRLVCFVLSNLLMLYTTWLIFSGTWQQAGINLGMTTPVMGISQVWFFVPVLIFTAFAAAWFCLSLLRSLSGRISDEELIGVKESEEDFGIAQLPPGSGPPR